MVSNIRFYTFFAFISIIAISCQKEILTPEDFTNTTNWTIEEQTRVAKQYARIQNDMNGLLTHAFSGAVAQPDFYGMDMAATQTSCPSTRLSGSGDVLTMQFGEGATTENACSVLDHTEVGGILALNKNFCSDISKTRGCQPGFLEFDEFYIQGCTVEAIRLEENEDAHPTFYSLENCPDNQNAESDEMVNFWFGANDVWEMKFTQANGNITTFNPVDNGKGAFMSVELPNIFSNELSSEDLYSTSYQISLLEQGDRIYNKVNFEGAGDNGEDISLWVMTTEELIYEPYQCKNTISGKVLLMDLNFTPLMSIDYGAGMEEMQEGEYDNIVQICPCDNNGNAITDSPNCIVTGCLPL